MPEDKEITNTELSRDLHDLSCEVIRLRDAIYGANGQIGLVARVKAVEDAMADIKRILWLIFAALMTGTVALFINLILQHGPTLVK